MWGVAKISGFVFKVLRVYGPVIRHSCVSKLHTADSAGLYTATLHRHWRCRVRSTATTKVGPVAALGHAGMPQRR